MRILHVINRFSVANGAAMVIQSIVPTLISNGHQVDVLGLVDITPSCADVFIKMGCGYKHLNPEGTTLYSPSILRKLSKEMKKYDAVHAHLFPSFYWVSLVKLLCGYKGKIFFTEHSTNNNRQKPYLRLLERFIYRRYDGIIAISEAVSQNMIAHLKKDYGVSVINNGIDVDHYKNHEPISREELNIPADAVILTQVARFGPEKDQMTALKALANLPENYYMVFVGGGSLMAKHQEAAKEMKVEDRVRFLGIRRDVAAILKASDIVVMSSHFEGFGLTAIEGMAAGKPVVASEVPGLKDVVKDAGLLFEAHNDVQLAEAIKALAENKELYAETVQKCEARARVYSSDAMAQLYEKIYTTGKL